jgi:hypothetical protein
VGESGSVLAPNFDLFSDLLVELADKSGASLEPVSLNFEQRFKCYDRVAELFMWKLVLEKSPKKNVSCKG